MNLLIKWLRPKRDPSDYITGVYVTHVEPNGITHLRYFTSHIALVRHTGLLKAQSIDYTVREAA